MKISILFALAALFIPSSAQLGPIRPEHHPSSALRESIRRMRLSIERELLYVARLESSLGAASVRQTAAETELDEDDGFAELVNDGSSIFRPLLPGVRVPNASEFDPSMQPDPSSPDLVAETPDPAVTLAPSPDVNPAPSQFPLATIKPTKTPAVDVPRETPPQAGTDPMVFSPSMDVVPMEPSASVEVPDQDAAADNPDTDVNPSPPADDGAVCFPAHATVELQDGSVKLMSHVELGDRVRVGPTLFSEVFMFTHKLANVQYRFVRIETESGQSLSLTKGHYLYVNGATVAASTVKPGDSVMLADHSISTVVNVDQVMSRGLYNPQTVHGDIVVNGLRATTYTTAVDRHMAHALLAPLRAAYSSIGWSLSAFHSGADRIANLVPSGSLF